MIRDYGGVGLLTVDAPTSRKQTPVNAFPIVAFVEKLAPFLHSGKQVFISSGLFSAELLYALLPYEICILTNDVRAVSMKHQNQKALVSISGGTLEKDTNALVGDFALHSFHKVTPTIILLKPKALTLMKFQPKR